MSTTDKRDADGRYNHSLDRVCVCGHRKGEHLAARPYPMPDDEGNCETTVRANE
jgi:hypothetical protein